jgi:hypothetical protein
MEPWMATIIRVELDETVEQTAQVALTSLCESSLTDTAAMPIMLFPIRNQEDPVWKQRLESDDWLCTTESKFSLLHCTEYQKTLYAAQQLRGPAGAWWTSYTAALLADHHVPWGEFRVAFRGHHLSAGRMRRKLTEFLDLH